MKTFIFAIVSIILFNLMACSTTKIPVATGGSRADATIELSYEYGLFEKPVVDWGKASITAQKRCRAWGYSGAEPFGGTKTTCQAYNRNNNCLQYLVTAKYQCIGNID